jgi:hypothetical protein
LLQLSLQKAKNDDDLLDQLLEELCVQKTNGRRRPEKCGDDDEKERRKNRWLLFCAFVRTCHTLHEHIYFFRSFRLLQKQAGPVYNTLEDIPTYFSNAPQIRRLCFTVRNGYDATFY